MDGVAVKAFLSECIPAPSQSPLGEYYWFTCFYFGRLDRYFDSEENRDDSEVYYCSSEIVSLFIVTMPFFICVYIYMPVVSLVDFVRKILLLFVNYVFRVLFPWNIILL